MKRIALFVSLSLAGAALAAENILTDQEVANGWQLLFDGKTTAGWRALGSPDFPKSGWQIADGTLTITKNAKVGDIITTKSYKNFELVFEFKLTEGANGGVKYFVQPGAKPTDKHGLGCEFQVLDDDKHPDAKLGRDGNRTISSLYDLIPAAASKSPSPIGEWNTARILVQGGHVEHWLNGAKVLEYERGSSEFRAAVAASKYKNIAGFGEWPAGHILLQEHGDAVFFRNVKIRVIPAP